MGTGPAPNAGLCFSIHDSLRQPVYVPPVSVTPPFPHPHRPHCRSRFRHPSPPLLGLPGACPGRLLFALRPATTGECERGGVRAGVGKRDGGWGLPRPRSNPLAQGRAPHRKKLIIPSCLPVFSGSPPTSLCIQLHRRPSLRYSLYDFLIHLILSLASTWLHYYTSPSTWYSDYRLTSHIPRLGSNTTPTLPSTGHLAI